MVQAIFCQIKTKVVKDPQSGFVESFHIVALTKLTNLDKSTEFPPDHHCFDLLCTKLISKRKIYDTLRFENTIYKQFGLIMLSTDNWVCLALDLP